MLGRLKKALTIQNNAADVTEMRRRLARQRRRANELEARLREAESPTGAVSAFHRLYYGLGSEGKTWKDTRWMGVPVMKLPLDLWVYQEILYETRPELILETGTADGGSALYLAHLCDLLGTGRIVTIDVTERGPSGKPRPEHPRVRYLLGSSTDEAVLDEVRGEAGNSERVMVILDSDHSEGHVLDELGMYSPLVGNDQYLIVEDTNVNGHPVFLGHGPGPMEALERFLSYSADFERDESREKLLFTFNPKGYLRRVQ